VWSVLDLDDDQDDDWTSVPPCFYQSNYNYSPGAYGVKIGFVDTGLDGEMTNNNTDWIHNHVEFDNRLLNNVPEMNGVPAVDEDINGLVDDRRSWNFVTSTPFPLDDQDHGTHVAGIVAEILNHNNDLQSKLLAIKTQNESGIGSLWQLAQGLDYALQRQVHVVNMSVGYWSPVLADGKTSVLEYMLEWAAIYRNVLVVAAAGNDGLNLNQPVTLSDGSQARFLPAMLPNDNLIVVGALTCGNQLASFSNYGALTVDIAAPGVQIFSAVQGGNYAYKTGTSMATAFVSALAALEGSETQVFLWKRTKELLLDKALKTTALQGKIGERRYIRVTENNTAESLTVTLSASAVLCAGNAPVLTAWPAGGSSYQYLWSTGAQTQSIGISSAGTYTVTVVTGSGASISAQHLFTQAAAPYVQVAASTSTNGLMEYSIVQPVTGAVYYWQNGSADTQVVLPSNQNYSVTMTLANGCKSSVSNTTNLTQLLLAGDTICLGTQAVLTPISTQAIQSYQWTTGAQTSTLAVSPTANTTYTVTVTTMSGLTQTASARVVVYKTPKLSAMPALTTCPCNSVLIHAVATGPGAPYTYSWQPGGFATASVELTPSVTTTYSVTVTNQLGCTSSRSVKVSSVCQSPQINNVLFLNNKLTVGWQAGCSLSSRQLRWRCAGSSQWKNVHIAPNATTQTSTVTGGCSQVEWQMRNRCCNGRNSAFTPIQLTGMAGNSSFEEQSATIQDDLVLYPVPAQQTLEVMSQQKQPVRVLSVVNSLGQDMLTFDDLPKDYQLLDVSALPGGVYGLKCVLNGKLIVYRFVKE